VEQMRIPINARLLALIGLTIGLICLCAANIAQAQDRTEKILSPEYKAAFEKQISSLICMSSDGNLVLDPYGKITGTTSIESRRDLFTDSGWLEYKAFSLMRQKYLQSGQELTQHSKTEFGRSRQGTQKYRLAQNGEVIFEAEIATSTQSYDVISLNMGKAYNVRVSFIPNKENDPSSVRITSWKAGP